MPRKTPQTKKEEAYEHERRSQAWSNSKADRRNRPRVKSRAHRMERRSARQLLATPPWLEDADGADAMNARVREAWVEARRASPRFESASVPLREWLVDRIKERSGRAGSGFFGTHAYDPARHRKPFTAFLRNVLDGGTAQPSRLARMLYETLHLPDEMSRASSQREFPWWPDRSRWLRQFLRDCPEWRAPLASWMEGQLAPGTVASRASHSASQSPARRRAGPPSR